MQSVTDAEFQAEVLGSPQPVVVDFWAPWCGPCRMLSPRLEALEPVYGHSVRFVQMNVDDNPETPSRYGIMSIPTLLFVREGEVREQLVGVQPEQRLRDALDALAE